MLTLHLYSMSTEPVAEPVVATHSDSDAEIVQDDDEELVNTTDKGSSQSRGEKKARKALAKMGLKPVKGITRVTIRRSKHVNPVAEC